MILSLMCQFQLVFSFVLSLENLNTPPLYSTADSTGSNSSQINQPDIGLKKP